MALTNEGGLDRGIRVILGIVLLYLGWGGVVAGGLGLVLKIIGFVPLLTGIVGVCPAYMLFGVRTCRTARS
jgi:threonine/homoserine/homoserine lactone efflux protein